MGYSLMRDRKMSALLLSLLLVGCDGAAAPTRGENAANDGVAGPEGAAAVAAAPQAGAPLSAVDRLAILSAAGFTRHPTDPGLWELGGDEGSCSITEVDIAQMRDVNGDGQAEAIIAADGPCYGRLGPNHLLLALSSKGWQLIEADMGREPSFHARKGIAWPDIELGDSAPAGSACVDFLRWNGAEYALGGTSQRGRICTIKQPEKLGRVAFPPLTKGYYAVNKSCDQALRGASGMEPPSAIVRFDATSFRSYDGGPLIEGFEALGDGRYLVKGKRFDENDRSTPDEFVIWVENDRSFLTENPAARYSFCPLNLIPRDVRSDWFEF